jgi:hypothetical protein
VEGGAWRVEGNGHDRCGRREAVMAEGERQVRILIDRRPTNAHIGEKGRPGYYADIVMCVEDSGFVFGAGTANPEEGDAAIVAQVEKVLRAVSDAAPGRPVLWMVRQGRVAEAVAARVGAENVLLAQGEAFAPWDEAYLSMDQHMGSGGAMLPYLWRGDVSEEEVAELFEAAADFSKVRPWQLIPSDVLHRAPPAGPGEPPLLITVMGESKIARGLALFDTEADFQAMMEDRLPHNVVYASLEPVAKMPHTVTEEAERHGWRLNSKSAFPMVVRVRHGEAAPYTGDDVRRVTRAFRLIGEAAGAAREARKRRR